MAVSPIIRRFERSGNGETKIEVEVEVEVEVVEPTVQPRLGILKKDSQQSQR